MAKKELMAYSAKEKRWQKKFGGNPKPYKRSVRQLQKDYPDLVSSLTKEGTREAANRWWEAKEQELAEQAIENEPTFEELRSKATLNKTEKEKFATLVQEKLLRAETIFQMAGLKAGMTDDDLEQLSPSQVKLAEAAFEAAIDDQVVTEQIDQDRTIVHQVEKWLDHRYRLAKLKEKQPEKNKKLPSLAAYGQNKAHVATLRDWLEADASIDEITSAWLADFRDHLIDKVDDDELQPKSAINILGTVSQFVDWLAIEREMIVRPNLLAKKGWKQLTYDPQAYPMAVETFRKVHGVADDLTKLYLLLMANCGYTAKDISDLKLKEVNWTKGRIKRRRSKGSGYKNAPVVNRPLWTETLQLLERFGHKKGEQVLTSETGNPLVVGRKDLIAERIKAAIKEAGFKSGPHHRPKDIRSGCATLINAAKEYRGWETYFLGQSPQGVAAKHYVGENADKQEEFDELTVWLRSQWLGSAAQGQ